MWYFAGIIGDKELADINIDHILPFKLYQIYNGGYILKKDLILKPKTVYGSYLINTSYKLTVTKIDNIYEFIESNEYTHYFKLFCNSKHRQYKIKSFPFK